MNNENMEISVMMMTIMTIFDLSDNIDDFGQFFDNTNNNLQPRQQERGSNNRALH